MEKKKRKKENKKKHLLRRALHLHPLFNMEGIINKSIHLKLHAERKPNDLRQNKPPVKVKTISEAITWLSRHHI
jgi:hypothetical protein